MIVFTHGKDQDDNLYTFLSTEYKGVRYAIHNHKLGCCYWVDNYFFFPEQLPKCNTINQLKACFWEVGSDIAHSITHPEDSLFAIVQAKVDKFNKENP